MTDLTNTLTTLPANGTRLPDGLALRLTKGNGMAVLGCSRIGAAPAAEELTAVIAAVREAFAPTVLFQAEQVERRENQDGQHVIQRLYWPLEQIAVVPELVQASLFVKGGAG